MTQASATQAFLALLARAEAASAAQTWTEAVALWNDVVIRNPVDGHNWLMLAEACFDARAYRQAIVAYEQVHALGADPPADAVYRIACCHARLGEPERALTWLEQAFTLGYRYLAHVQTDAALQPLHDDPRFRDLVALIDPTTMTRTAGWRHDVALFAREVKRRGTAPFRHVSEAEFDTAVDTLH